MPRKTNANPKIAVADIVQNVPDRDYETFTTVLPPFTAFLETYLATNPGLDTQIAGATKVKFSATELVINTLIVSK